MTNLQRCIKHFHASKVYISILHCLYDQTSSLTMHQAPFHGGSTIYRQILDILAFVDKLESTGSVAGVVEENNRTEARQCIKRVDPVKVMYVCMCVCVYVPARFRPRAIVSGRDGLISAVEIMEWMESRKRSSINEERIRHRYLA